MCGLIQNLILGKILWLISYSDHIIFKGWKIHDETVKQLQDHRRTRNWVLFHFHYQQTLLKLYKDPNTCAPIETFIPRGKGMIAQISSRKAKIKRSFPWHILWTIAVIFQINQNIPFKLYSLFNLFFSSQIIVCESRNSWK